MFVRLRDLLIITCMLLSSTVNQGMVQTLDRLCATGSSNGVTASNIYSYKSKMNDFNEALDWYFQLAFKSDGQWSFDDISQTSPPIDSQDLVSGTNRYKLSAFSDKILNLLKLEILDNAGIGHILTPERIDSLGITPLGVNQTFGYQSGVVGSGFGNSFQQLYIAAAPGLPTNYLKLGDYIYLRPNPNYNSTAGLKAYVNRPGIKFNFNTFTVTSATPAVFTATAHGLAAGDTVILETDGALFTGLSVDTQYYVIATGLTVNTFELALTAGGTALNTSGTQSGTHSVLKTNAEPGIIQSHHIFLVRRAAVTYLNYTNSFKMGTLPQQVAADEQTIMEYFAKRGKDIRPRLSPFAEDNR